MNELDYRTARSQGAILETNKVLRNTYLLLSMTLLFSACTAGVSMLLNLGPGVGMILSLISFGLLFWVQKTADSGQGLIAVFAFTGCLGAALGPMLNRYLALANGPSVVMQALGGTALIFLTLSGYVLTTRKDFSYMRGFLVTGAIVMLVGLVLSIFIPALQLAVSAAVIMLMSGFILFDTSRIINGGETNYIRATVSLYLSIYNIFIHLLRLLGGSGNR